MEDGFVGLNGKVGGQLRCNLVDREFNPFIYIFGLIENGKFQEIHEDEEELMFKFKQKYSKELLTIINF